MQIADDHDLWIIAETSIDTAYLQQTVLYLSPEVVLQ